MLATTKKGLRSINGKHYSIKMEMRCKKNVIKNCLPHKLKTGEVERRFYMSEIALSYDWQAYEILYEEWSTSKIYGQAEYPWLVILVRFTRLTIFEIGRP